MPTELERYEALKEAYESGINTVSYGGKTVTYRDSDSMLKVLRQMGRRLGLVKKPRRAVLIRDGRTFY